MSGRDEVERVDFATRAAMISPMREGLFSTHPSLGDRVDALRGAMPSMVDSPAVTASAIFSRPAPSGALASPNAVRMRHGGLVVSAPDPRAATRGFAGALFEGVPDLSFPVQVAFWRALGRELAAGKPPTWVSHPYILASAVALNCAVLFAFSPSTFSPLSFAAPTPRSMIPAIDRNSRGATRRQFPTLSVRPRGG